MSQVERGADLGSMLRHLNHFAVQKLASSSFYFTLAAVRFYQSRGCLQFAGAGHPPAIVIRRGQSPSLLESTCMILGLFTKPVGAESGVATNIHMCAPALIYTHRLPHRFTFSQ